MSHSDASVTLLSLQNKNRRTAFIVLAVVFLMLGAAYAAVPLYRLFCQVTGVGGQAVRELSNEPLVPIAREMTVRFNTDVSPSLPWSFVAEQGPVTAAIGKEVFASFSAINNSDEATAGTALFNVTPEAAGKYFHKTQCFCFDYQLIAPHSTAHFPVVFYVDPAIDNDPQLDGVKSLTLSYSFFKADSPELESALEVFSQSQKSGTTSVPVNR